MCVCVCVLTYIPHTNIHMSKKTYTQTHTSTPTHTKTNPHKTNSLSFTLYPLYPTQYKTTPTPLTCSITPYLVLAMSTGMEAAVVIRPLIILATKCRNRPSEKYPDHTHTHTHTAVVTHLGVLCPSRGEES